MSNPGQPTLHPGANGAAVRRLQRALHRASVLDFPTLDGAFGPDTERHLRDFQSSHALTVDGIVGPATWAALPDGGPMPVLQEGANQPIVARLQTVLASVSSEGFFTLPSPGPADGSFGPLTKASVQGLQSDPHNHLAPDGIVGDLTWAIPLAFGEELEMAVGLEFVSS
jgi:peptidoglycan hydrolase-like protein with peptidoglycan-binding domain